MPSKKPLRIRENSISVRFDSAVDQRLRFMAAQLGYNITDYLTVLINGQKPVARPAAELQQIALAGDRVLRAIAMLGASEGDSTYDDSTCDHSGTIKVLREAGRFIEGELLKGTPAYHEAAHAEVKAQRGEESWGELEALE
jgi:hypothetical protein